MPQFAVSNLRIESANSDADAYLSDGDGCIDCSIIRVIPVSKHPRFDIGTISEARSRGRVPVRIWYIVAPRLYISERFQSIFSADCVSLIFDIRFLIDAGHNTG